MEQATIKIKLHRHEAINKYNQLVTMFTNSIRDHSPRSLLLLIRATYIKVLFSGHLRTHWSQAASTVSECFRLRGASSSRVNISLLSLTRLKLDSNFSAL